MAASIKDYFNTSKYLKKFWPRSPKSSPVWKENEWLLTNYIKATDEIKKRLRGRKISVLDISTGPALAHALTCTKIATEIQVSDYSERNRNLLRNMKYPYWYEYAKEVLKMEKEKYDFKSIYKRLHLMRDLIEKNEVVKVDMKTNQMFFPEIKTHKYHLVSMHFVTDSITGSKPEYYQMMDKLIQKLHSHTYFLISALINCTKWTDGSRYYPSPNITYSEILEHLRHNGLEIIFANELQQEEGVGIDGGMAVYLCKKP